MIIDFHTHIFPEKIAVRTIEQLEMRCNIKASTNGMINGLLDSMERCGIDLSVILPVATKPDQFENIQAFAKMINEQYSGKLLSFGGIHPDSEDYKKELKQIADMGFVGIKIHPDYQRVMIDDIRYLRILEYATELGLIVITHAGIDIGFPELVHCPPDRMRKVLDKIKPKKMVLAHFGGFGQWEAVEELLAGQDVWLDTAFIFHAITQEQFMRIYEKHDKTKILFATDSPWSDMKKGVEWINQLPITEGEKEAIFSKNAQALFKNS